MSSKYGTLTIDRLKSELRRRNARVSGRKQELIDRLEAYDRNSNFSRPDSPLQTEYVMTLPDPKLYLDLHGDRKIPEVTVEGIQTYLNKFEKDFDTTPVDLYKERHLCYIRVCDNDQSESGCFLKSACRAEMRKAVVYSIDIKISPEGVVEEAQCECGAGMGPTAHCKHVCAVLYGCYMFGKNGTATVESTCTDKLQTFHRVKKHVGSPVKSCDLKMCGADESTCVSFDPRPTKYRKLDCYPDFFRNTCLNYRGISKLPVFQLFQPANIRAFANDHDYCTKTMEDHFLEDIGVKNPSKERVNAIQNNTRGQATNGLWREERTKRIQSSTFGRICKATERLDKTKLAKELVSPKPFSSKYTDHGIKYEKQAIKKYEEIHHCRVDECGIFVSQTLPFLGSSPDGVVSKDVIVEVKCPYTAFKKQITQQTVPYMKLTGEHQLELDTQHNYHYQIQGQLFCTGSTCCDFIVYTLADMKCVRIERDNNFISAMLEKLEKFYRDYFEPALLDKFLYKDF